MNAPSIRRACSTVNLNLMLDESSTNADRCWQRMLQALGNPEDTEWTGDAYALTESLTFDTDNKASILSCIISARENSRHVREQISTEQWTRLNSLYLQVTRPDMRNTPDGSIMADSGQPTEFLQQVMEAVHQFQGVSDSTMSHGEGWQFIQVGRYIERASATAMLLEAYHEDLWQHSDRIPEGNEYLEWMGLLRSATAFEAYCKVYTADITPDRILEFLLLDEEFPHSSVSPSTHCRSLSKLSTARAARAVPSRYAVWWAVCRHRSTTRASRKFSTATSSRIFAAFSFNAATFTT